MPYYIVDIKEVVHFKYNSYTQSFILTRYCLPVCVINCIVVMEYSGFPKLFEMSFSFYFLNVWAIVTCIFFWDTLIHFWRNGDLTKPRFLPLKPLFDRTLKSLDSFFHPYIPHLECPFLKRITKSFSVNRTIWFTKI